MCAVPLSEDAAPILKGDFYEVEQYEDLDRWDNSFSDGVWSALRDIRPDDGFCSDAGRPRSVEKLALGGQGFRPLPRIHLHSW